MEQNHQKLCQALSDYFHKQGYRGHTRIMCLYVLQELRQNPEYYDPYSPFSAILLHRFETAVAKKTDIFKTIKTISLWSKKMNRPQQHSGSIISEFRANLEILATVRQKKKRLDSAGDIENAKFIAEALRTKSEYSDEFLRRTIHSAEYLELFLYTKRNPTELIPSKETVIAKLQEYRQLLDQTLIQSPNPKESRKI